MKWVVLEFIFGIRVVIGTKFGSGLLPDLTPALDFMFNTDLDLGMEVTFGNEDDF